MKVILYSLFLILTGCSLAEKVGEKLIDRLELKDLEPNQKKLLEESDEEVAYLKDQLEKMEKQLVDNAPPKKIEKVKHESNIHVHQYYLEKNHLSDAEKARIQAKIARHKKKLKELE